MPTKNNAISKEVWDDRATAVINVAKTYDIYTGPMPEDRATRIKVADALIDKAIEARSRGVQNKPITELLFVAEVTLGKEPVNENNDNNGPEAIYQKAIKEFTEENLPIPPEIESDPPVLPVDVSERPNKEVRYLHSAFNACSARARYLLGVEEAGEAAAKQIADSIYNEWLVDAERKDDHTGRGKTKEVLVAEALAENAELAKWRDRQSQHSIASGKFKTLFEIYDDAADRLNKESIMRQMERTQ